MKIAENCIKHNVMTILVYILIAVFGFYCFQSLPLALMPEMELPVAIVYSTYAGAGPEDIEQQVTEPLEAACASLSGLESLTSTAPSQPIMDAPRGVQKYSSPSPRSTPSGARSMPVRSSFA